MALEKEKYEAFKNSVLRALEELNSTELEYISEWIYLYPTHSLKINNIAIENTYSIPTGFDGYGLADLKRMVNEGVLTIQSETEEDADTLEKVIIFKLNNNLIAEKLSL